MRVIFKVYRSLAKYRVFVFIILFLKLFFWLTILSYWKVNSNLKSVGYPGDQERFITKFNAPDPNHPKLARAFVYCNRPVDIQIKAEMMATNVLDTHQLSLKSVIIVIRHGDRGPLRSIASLKSINCDPFKAMPRISSKSSSYPHYELHSSPEFLNFEYNLYQRYLASKYKLNRSIKFPLKYDIFPPATCEIGHLTMLGAMQHLVLGSNLAKIYKNHLKIDIHSKKNIEAFTTSFPRTFQSALAFLYGFVDPSTSLDFKNFPVVQNTVGTFFCSSKEFCIEKCDKMAVLAKSIDEARKNIIDFHPAVTKLINDLKMTFITHHNDSKVFSKHEWVFDALMGYVCHGHSLPCSRANENDNNEMQKCASMDQIRQLIAFHDHCLKQISSLEAFKRLSWIKMMGFFHKLIYHLDRLTEENHSKIRKLLLYSAHDITLTPIASALDFFDGVLPPYASRIIFEVYEQNGNNKDEAKSLFLRLLYNGKDVTKFTEICKNSSLTENSKCIDFSATTSDGDIQTYTVILAEHFKEHIRTKFQEIMNATTFEEGCKK